MSRRLPILLTSAGRRVALLELLRADAEALGFEPQIIVGELQPDLSAAAGLADKPVRLPPVSAPEYADAVLDVCRREGVRLLVPTIDPELEAMARRREDFRSEGVLINVSTPEAVAVARDKLATARALETAGVPTPRTATPDGVLAAPDDWSWPLIFKPRDGSSSVGLRRVARPADLEEAMRARTGGLVQALAEGPEFTVNMFVDADGACRAAVPHLRYEVRGGEVSKGVTVRVPALTEAAHRIAAGLPGLFGALCFQAILTDQGPVVFEINARFGGGFPLAHRAGAPFTRWLIQMAVGQTPEMADDWREGVTMLRYDAAVFGEVGAEGMAAWRG